MVTLANGTTVNYGQPSGNITPYPGDWGTTAQEQNLAGGGAAWGLIAVDNKTGVIYFSTGHPSDAYDASLRPGPDLSRLRRGAEHDRREDVVVLPDDLPRHHGARGRLEREPLQR